MNRRDKAKKRFPKLTSACVDKLFDADPSGGAYGMWMAQAVAERTRRSEVIAAVHEFHQVKKRFPPDERDLYRYNFQRLKRALEGLPPSKRKQKIKNPGYKLIRKFDNVSFYRVITLSGMKRLGQGTKWCLTQAHHFENHGDHLIVIAINHLREARHPFSKLALLSGPGEILSSSFISWNTLKKFTERSKQPKPKLNNEISNWEIYDAANNSLSWHGGYAAAQEILDILIGQYGATEHILRRLHNPKIPKLKEAIAACRKSEHLVPLAKTFKRMQLNPLSLLDHPRARSQNICQQIWDISTTKHRGNLSTENLKTLARKPAINVPGLLTLFLDRPSRVSIDDLVQNHHLTKASKLRVLEVLQNRLKVSL